MLQKLKISRQWHRSIGFQPLAKLTKCHAGKNQNQIDSHIEECSTTSQLSLTNLVDASQHDKLDSRKEYARSRLEYRNIDKLCN